MTIERKAPNLNRSDIPSPCFVLDEALLKRNLRILSEVKKTSGAKILCALKGYAMWSTFPLLAEHLDGATASSLHEALLCYEKFKKKAHLCAPVYFENEFEKLVKVSDHITFNSLRQYRKFKHQALSQGLKLALRINPEYSDVSPAIYNPCTPGSRLGITRAAFGTEIPDHISGLHFHTLCEQNAQALKNTLDVIERKWGAMIDQIEWINMGGGHHITRADYDVPLLAKTIRTFRNRHNNLEVYLEPGEAIGWQTGYLLSTVQDIVHANGIQTAMLDVSFSAHMPDCLEMPYKPKIWHAMEPDRAKPTYRMGGMTCLAGDYMGDYAFAKALVPGDRIVFDDMIHYTMVKTTTFNGVRLPSIGILKENGSFELVRSFGYEDYKNRLS